MRFSLTVALFLLSPGAWAGETIVNLDGEVPGDELDHFFVPFDVPAGTVEIEVRHDDLSTVNILDWGLEDARGTFRGWGGGNEEPGVVGLDAASRSYVPGAIEAGTWRVVVGKARVNDLPGQYSIEVVLRDVPTLAPQPDRVPYAPATPLSAAAGWYAGDLHVHSSESGDARPDLDEIASFARGRGLDFVAISDHNTVTGQDFFAAAQDLHPDLLFMPSVEFTTYAGHLNAIGATSWVDHKIGQAGVTIAAASTEFRSQGALITINHPTMDLGPLCIGCIWEHALEPSQLDAVEIASGGLDPFFATFSDDAIEYWDDLCAAGAHVAAIGGSDDHKAGVDLNMFQSPIGDATTMVFAESLSHDAIMKGIRDGRTVVKLQGPDDPMVILDSPERTGDRIEGASPTITIRVTGASGQTLHLVRNGERQAGIPIDSDPFDHEEELVPPPSGEDRVRAEIWVDGSRRVVTSHLWLQPGTGSETDSDGATGGATDHSGCSCRSTGDRGEVWALVAFAGVRRRRRLLA